MKLKEIIKKFKLYSKTNWQVTDYLMENNFINDEVRNPIDEKDQSPYVCIRDLKGYSLYLPAGYLEEFYNSKYYSPEYMLINLSELKRDRRKRNYTSDVYDNITPAEVKLKLVDYIVINNYRLYIVYTTDLNYDDDLYNDLLNFNKIESRY